MGELRGYGGLEEEGGGGERRGEVMVVKEQDKCNRSRMI